MTISEIYTAIGERVDDPDKTQYANRYENVFISALTELIKLRDENGFYIFSPEEYPELAQPEQIEPSFINGWYKHEISGTERIMLIRSVYVDPISENAGILFVEKTFLDLQNIMRNMYLKPYGTEAYWAKKGNGIYLACLYSERLRVNLDIIKNPDPSSWGTSNLETVKGYGRSFLNACISKASEILRKEIGLE